MRGKIKNVIGLSLNGYTVGQYLTSQLVMSFVFIGTYNNKFIFFTTWLETLN